MDDLRTGKALKYSAMNLADSIITIDVPDLWLTDKKAGSSVQKQWTLRPRGVLEQGIASPTIIVVLKPAPADTSAAALDALFHREATAVRYDWHVPGLANVETTSETIGGITARRYDFDSTRGAKDQSTGSAVYLLKDGQLIVFWLKTPVSYEVVAREVFSRVTQSITFVALPTDRSSGRGRR
jgi:hypothetical protein